MNIVNNLIKNRIIFNIFDISGSSTLIDKTIGKNYFFENIGE